MPVIYCDTRQKAGKHEHKNGWWAAHGIELVDRALPFGDYTTDGSNISVDTKMSVQELVMDIGKDHSRFVREIERANAAGHRLVVLVEQPRRAYKALEELNGWTSTVCWRCRHRKTCNPHEVKGRRCRRGIKPMQGKTAYAICNSLVRKYGVVIEFVPKAEAAHRICELLGVPYGEDSEG